MDINSLIGWEVSKIEIDDGDIVFTFTKPQWYRKKLTIRWSYDYGNTPCLDAYLDDRLVIDEGKIVGKEE